MQCNAVEPFVSFIEKSPKTFRTFFFKGPPNKTSYLTILLSIRRIFSDGWRPRASELRGNDTYLGILFKRADTMDNNLP